MAEIDISITMAMILGTMLAVLAGLTQLQTTREASSSTFLPSAETAPSKRAYELFVAIYTPVWIGIFAVVVALQLYESFTAWSYLQLCGGLALPFLLQPIVFPSAGFGSPDAKRPLFQRYAFKANLWLAVYSFIGNYWYTHYFYSVLKAEYTMPGHRLNNVPIAMYFATHFYFSTYHFFANALLRKVVTTYEAGFWRRVLFVAVVVVFSYFTAFMETLSISSYPYWRFEDRYTAYTVGSAFYGIYFLVSFPGFYAFDQHIDEKNSQQVTLWDTFVSSCGHGMMILTLLDFVRLYLDIPLIVGTSGLTCTSSEYS
jgi:cycloeucalenol cycloisomerase